MPLTQRTAAEPPAAAELVEYSWEEIRTHGRPDDLWIVLDGFVYDVSEWMREHPGGADVLLSSHGGDASKAFAEVGHSYGARLQTEAFRIGRVRPGPAPAAAPAAADDDKPLEISSAV